MPGRDHEKPKKGGKGKGLATRRSEFVLGTMVTATARLGHVAHIVNEAQHQWQRQLVEFISELGDKELDSDALVMAKI